MENVMAGINDEELGSLSLEVMDYASNVSEILDRIDACMDKLSTYYQGTPCRKIMERYREMQLSYQTIKNNIVSYSDDFVTLINKMHENDQYLSGLFQGFTEDTRNQIRNNHFSLK